MIKRSIDQAKLLFLYFLKSSAAFASEPAKTGILHQVSSQAQTQAQQQQRIEAPTLNRLEFEPMGGYISLRLARRADIPSIQRCNLATLPENYNESFYANHMRHWPELALVAEHVTSHSRYESNLGRKRRTGRSLLESIAGGSSKAKVAPSDNARNEQCQIVGYVLGKVVKTPRAEHSRPFERSWVQDDDNGFLPPSARRVKAYEDLGHVTSLAILDGYRRKGLAAHLMNQLHYEMQHCYDADAVGLHVRVSNEAATNLYINSMGYRVDDVIPGYYQDGEDAYLMRKDFTLCDGYEQQQQQQQHHHQQQQPTTLEKNLEEYGDVMENSANASGKKIFFPNFYNAQSSSAKRELILPRTIFEFKSEKILDTTASELDSDSMESEQDNHSAVSATASLH